MSIGLPADGSVVPAREVVVSGTASGSTETWLDGGEDGFGEGTLDALEVRDGALALKPMLRDDFDDGTFDTTAWERFDLGGVTTLEEDGGLHQFGRSNVSSYWGGISYIFSKGPVGDSVEAYLAACVGSGSGFWSMLVLYQDDSNQAGIGVIEDTGRGWNDYTIYWGCIDQGVQSNGVIKRGREHKYGISQSGGMVDLLVDDVVVKSLSMTIASPRAKLFSSARTTGDTVDAIWDDFRSAPVSKGSFISGVHDTRSVDPVLTRVDWNATTPQGTSVEMEVRSSAQPDMSSATGWARVSEGQTTDLPGVMRYLQYRATLAATSADSPVLRDVSIAYLKPVRLVEVSLDGANWDVADGTMTWTATMVLPEGLSTVWARATDVAGGSRLTSITVLVNAAPPVGSIVINDGATMTASASVTLTLEATDASGVASMLISESPDFSGAAWQPYAPTLRWTLSSGEGEKTVFAMFRDTSGLISEPVSDGIVLDTMAPEGSVVIDGGATYTRSLDVDLTLSARDMLGVVGMRVWEDARSGPAVWEAYSTTRPFTLSPGDGLKTVHAEFKDELGHVSVAATDTIYLATAPPFSTVFIDGGATYATTREVTLALGFEGALPAETMQVGEDPFLVAAEWVAATESLPFTLSSGDGTKTVHVRARDAAGGVGAISQDDIVLDTTPPTTVMDGLPSKVGTTSFSVSWSGSDATSGIESYDVQYRDGEGPWTEWLVGTGSTNATFEGTDGHSYMFRARARDSAGNLGLYTDAVAGPVRVLVPIVTVSIEAPLPGATVQGWVAVRGTATHTDAGIGVRSVSVSVDGGPWLEAVGTTNWTFDLDADRLSDGEHVVRVVASDGERRSEEVVLPLVVDNGALRVPFYSWLLVIAIVVAVSVTVGYYMGTHSRRGPSTPAGQPPQGKPF